MAKEYTLSNKLHKNSQLLRKASYNQIKEWNSGVVDFDSNDRLRKLKDAIINNKLVVFWGAGLSMLAGCQSWIGLANDIIDAFTPKEFDYSEAELLKDLCSTDVRKVLTICRNAANGNEELKRIFDETIIKSVTPKKDSIFSEVHQTLLDLEALAYITTNVDRGIERLASSLKIGQKVYDLTQSDLPNLTDLVKNGNIFYLHGSTKDLSKSIFSNDSYFEFYNSNNSIKDLLANIFSSRVCVLFIGYGLGDYEILSNLFMAVRGRIDLTECYHYSLIPIFSNEIHRISIETRYLKMYSITPLFYFRDQENYGALRGILQELRKNVISLKSGLNPLSLKRKIDEVLLND